MFSSRQLIRQVKLFLLTSNHLTISYSLRCYILTARYILIIKIYTFDYLFLSQYFLYQHQPKRDWRIRGWVNVSHTRLLSYNIRKIRCS